MIFTVNCGKALKIKSMENTLSKFKVNINPNE